MPVGEQNKTNELNIVRQLLVSRDFGEPIINPRSFVGDQSRCLGKHLEPTSNWTYIK